MPELLLLDGYCLSSQMYDNPAYTPTGQFAPSVSGSYITLLMLFSFVTLSLPPPSFLPPSLPPSLPPFLPPSLPLFLPPSSLSPSLPQPLSASPSPLVNPRQEAYQMRQLSMSVTDNKSAAANLRAQLKGGLSQNPGTPQSGQGGSSISSTPSQSPSVQNGSLTPTPGPQKRKRDGKDRKNGPH